MKNIVITGGKGDIAIAIKNHLSKNTKYKLTNPGKNELNVLDFMSIDNFFKSNQVDVLINNAGYINPIILQEDSSDNEEASINTNLTGVFLCTMETLKHNPKALIINIGSSAGSSPHGNGWSSYCATKAAVIMATKCWAMEGIKAICISPGRSNTKMRNRLFPDEDQTTLLNPIDFAEVVEMAIEGEFPYGENIDVNVKNIKDILGGKRNSLQKSQAKF